MSCCLSFLRTSRPRGEKGRNLNNQSKTIERTSVDEKGKPAVVDELGFCKPSLKTMHDLISPDVPDVGKEKRPALGRCEKQHTFKDATFPDGEPNRKPTIVDEPARWETMTHAQMKQQARAFGSYLRRTHNIGLKEKVAIWSGNCPEWVLVDLSCAAFNWTSVPVYDTLGPDAASYIVADSGAQVLVCEAKTFKKVPELLKDEVYTSNDGSDLKVVVCIGKPDEATSAAIKKAKIKVLSFEDMLSHEIIEDTPPNSDDIATLMYTSGTTGMPDSVPFKLTHMDMIDLTPSLDLNESDEHLSYLPLAHIFERSIVMGVLNAGGVVYFASQGAEALLADLSIRQPTFFAGLPNEYENVCDDVKRGMNCFQKNLFDTAMAAKVKDLETGCGYWTLWDMLVFGKTKQALGGRVRFCVSGGVPISKDTLQFVSCALGVVQVYGPTETSNIGSYVNLV